MSTLTFHRREPRVRRGCKGPRAAEWLSAQDIVVPSAPNTWAESAGADGRGTLLVARLGASEFFLEADGPLEASPLRRMPTGETGHPGVYPVLREDAAFLVAGEGSADFFAQVCNVNLSALHPATQPVVMTSMIGVSVLIVPQSVGAAVQYRIWCDPTFASYLEGTLGDVVSECGGTHGGMAA